MHVRIYMFARIRVDLKLTVAYVNSMLACGRE